MLQTEGGSRDLFHASQLITTGTNTITAETHHFIYVVSLLWPDLESVCKRF